MLDTMVTQSYCGFLEKKTLLSMINGWRLRWFELNCEDCTLTYYASETDQEPIGCYVITEQCTIEVISDPSHPFTFKLGLPNKPAPFILAAPNMSIIEAWMLLLIQIQMGAIKPEEKFRTGESQDAVVSALSCPLTYNGGVSVKDMTYFVEIQGGEILDETPVRGGCEVLKRSIHKRQWRSRHLVLADHVLTLYASAGDAEKGVRPRGTRAFHPSSRLALLPPGFEGQLYGLALITGNPPYTDCVTLRVSFSDQESLQEWYEALRMEILRAVQYHHQQEQEEQQQQQEQEQQQDQQEQQEGQQQQQEGQTVIHRPRVSTTRDLQSITPPSLFRFNAASNILTLRKTDIYADFYLTHFVQFQSKSIYSQVVVFENQRYVPLVGWSSANLLFTDHAKLSDMAGRVFPEPNLKYTPPPPTNKWASDGYEGGGGDVTSQTAAGTGGKVKESLRQYSLTVPPTLGLLTFQVDTQYTATDPDGWSYALSFKRIQAHLTENSAHYFRKPSDFVRRRRWVRLVDLRFDREL